MCKIPSESWKSGSTAVTARGRAGMWVQSWVSGRDTVWGSSLLSCFLCLSSESPLLHSSHLECQSITRGIGVFNLGWFIHPPGHGGENRNAARFGQNQISTKKNLDQTDRPSWHKSSGNPEYWQTLLCLSWVTIPAISFTSLLFWVSPLPQTIFHIYIFHSTLFF